MSTKEDAERRFSQVAGERDYYKRMSERRERQRDQLREALEEILHDTGSFAAKHIARAALNAKEES